MNASRAAAAERRAEALGRVVSMLLQGIALHSFESASAEAMAFQTAIRKVRGDFEKVEDQDSTLLLAGAAIRLMEDYNDGIRRHSQAKQNEFEAAIGLLTEALLEVAHAGADTLVGFKEIERDLAAASSLEALRSARERLAGAVEEVREEVSNPLRKCGIPRGEVDRSTGLPDHGFAAGAIAEIWHSRDDYYAVVFTAERLETINMRFGFLAGDQILKMLSRNVAKSLTPDDRLFRWRGPCVMALIRRDAPEALVAADLARIAMARMEHAITLGEREVMLTISTSWNLFPLRTADGIEELLRQMTVPARRDVSASKARAGSTT